MRYVKWGNSWANKVNIPYLLQFRAVGVEAQLLSSKTPWLLWYCDQCRSQGHWQQQYDKSTRKDPAQRHQTRSLGVLSSHDRIQEFWHRYSLFVNEASVNALGDDTSYFDNRLSTTISQSSRSLDQLAHPNSTLEKPIILEKRLSKVELG